MFSRLLKKIGIVPEEARIQAAYKKGCDEGLIQGYQQAKGGFEGKIQDLQSQMERRFKVDEDQINLLGRLVNQLNERQSELTDETRTILRSMHRVLQDTNQTAGNETKNH